MSCKPGGMWGLRLGVDVLFEAALAQVGMAYGYIHVCVCVHREEYVLDV